MFTIIIATADRPDSLRLTLDALESVTVSFGEAVPILVVDNGGQHTAEPVVMNAQRHQPSIRYLASAPRNKAKALNLAIREATTEWLAFTDDDTLPPPDWLVKAREYAEARTPHEAERMGQGEQIDDRKKRLTDRQPPTAVDPESKGYSPTSKVHPLSASPLPRFAFGGRVIPEPTKAAHPRWLKSGGSGRLPIGPALVRYEPYPCDHVLGPLDPVPLGANFFARREVFERCGGYDESLWQRCGKAALGCEDAELGIRWRARGVTLVYASSCTMVHRILPERSGLFHHLQWSWKAGLREELLFGAEASATYLLRRTAHHGTRALVAAAKRDPACAVHELMEGARLWARLASRTKRFGVCQSTGHGQ